MMHEQSQLAKLRRAVIRRLARVLPARALRSLLPLQAAEQAALALRLAPKAAAPDRPVTSFAIPLVGRHQVTDWDIIEHSLEGCLKALMAQSDGNWRAVICSQTRPVACDLDPRIQFTPFEREIEGHDKVAKLEQLMQYCLRDHMTPGFLMPLDGDDLLHLSFVETLHRGGDAGLLVTNGLMQNADTGELGQTRARGLGALGQKPFWKFCGSCMALPIGRAADEEHGFFTALAQHEHRLYPYLAELAGIRLIEPEQDMALYVINHGENFETRRGRGGFKQRFIRRFALTGAAKAEALSGFEQGAKAPSTDP